nr:hypothetical protein [uncultured Pedobacter sp.]
MYLNNYQSYTFGIIILGLLSFIACEKTTETSKIIGFGEKVVLQQSDNVWFGADTITGIQIKINEIMDSRCPEDVKCIWAGEANVKLLATDLKDSVSLDLKIDPVKSSKTDTVKFTLNSKNYQALLYAVNPYPNSKNEGVKFATLTILK